MTCTAACNLLHAFLDGELDLVRHLEVENHLQDCKSCSEAHESHLNLRAGLQSEDFYHRAPAALRDRLTASLPPTGARAPRRLRHPWRWIGLAAAAACIALLSWMVGRLGLGLSPRAEDRLAEAVLVGHVRSLLEGHLTDKPSSDKHQVKPWFAGKIDYSFTVPDLDKQGYPLVGGRLDYLADRSVAALVYDRHGHKINLFLWPLLGTADTASEQLSRHGYQFVHWAQGRMQYWAVSDLNENELLEFAELVRGGGRN